MSQQLTSPQLSDALREHAADIVKHAARTHVLLTLAADMLRGQRTALEEIIKEVGTSTKANKIASAALSR